MASNNDNSNGSTSSCNNNNNNNNITIQLTVTSAQGAPRVPVTIDPSITAHQLRTQAAEATRIPRDSLKLIFRGRLIADSPDVAAVTEFKLEDGSVLHCMGKPAITTTTASVAAVAAAAAGGDHGTSTSTAHPVLPTVSVPSSTAASQEPATTTSRDGSSNNSDPLVLALQTLRTCNPPDVYQTALSTLGKILHNITTHPLEAKYRSLKVDNAAFQRRLGGVPGGDAALLACGFVLVDDEPDDEGEPATTTRKYVLPANADAWPVVQQAARTVQAAVAMASSSPSWNNSNSNNPMAAGVSSSGTMWPMPPPGSGMGAGGAGAGAGLVAAGWPPGMLDLSPEMQQLAVQMVSNPQALQAMFQDPMVQNVIRNDPRYANNPQAQQFLQELGNNPQMAQMMSQLMTTAHPPQGLAQMRSARGGGGEPAGFSTAAAAAAADPAQMAQMLQGIMAARNASSGASNRNAASSGGGTGPSGGASNNSGNNNTDEDLTEEEMIAEAIRRSLQDGNNGSGGGF